MKLRSADRLSIIVVGVVRIVERLPLRSVPWSIQPPKRSRSLFNDNEKRVSSHRVDRALKLGGWVGVWPFTEAVEMSCEAVDVGIERVVAAEYVFHDAHAAG